MKLKYKYKKSLKFVHPILSLSRSTRYGFIYVNKFNATFRSTIKIACVCKVIKVYTITMHIISILRVIFNTESIFYYSRDL